jgi:excisionase family DNA binding protein
MTKDPAKLTTRQVAERYSVNPDKVLAWIRAGELAAINVAEKAGGRPRYRIDPTDLAAFEARRLVRTQSSASIRRRKQTTNVTEFF